MYGFEYNISYLSLFLHFRPIFMAKQLISVLAFLKVSFFEAVLPWKGRMAHGLLKNGPMLRPWGC